MLADGVGNGRLRGNRQLKCVLCQRGDRCRLSVRGDPTLALDIIHLLLEHALVRAASEAEPLPSDSGSSLALDLVDSRECKDRAAWVRLWLQLARHLLPARRFFRVDGCQRCRWHLVTAVYGEVDPALSALFVGLGPTTRHNHAFLSIL